MKDQKLRTIMVLNSKGGAGKTTLSTNLAGYYASQGQVTVLKDYDPQGSSSDWLQHRPMTRATIHSINIAKSNGMAATRVWQTRMPQNAERLIIDSPAGIDLNRMSTELRNVDAILVPVMPSPIDIRASAMFIKDLIQHLKRYPGDIRVAAVASRVPEQCPAYNALKRIFENLEIPLVATLHQSVNYIHAAEHGISIFELEGHDVQQDRIAWEPLFAWLEERQPAANQGDRPHLFVVR